MHCRGIGVPASGCSTGGRYASMTVFFLFRLDHSVSPVRSGSEIVKVGEGPRVRGTYDYLYFNLSLTSVEFEAQTLRGYKPAR